MRAVLFTAVAILGLAAVSPPARAVGCLSGGAAGALAGHMAGHGVLGAIGGCIAGHEWHKHSLRQQDYQDQSSYESGRRSSDPNYRSPWTQ
jgi:outer membrane lipoprotein SlyB